ncbi:MAG: NAD(P)H-binding protein [Microlunatus sp.]
MNVVVFGASGRTGRLVVAEAASGGHRVVAVTRNPDSYRAPASVSVRRGDLLEPESLAGVLDGAEVVISAIGPDDGRAPTEVYSVGMRAITAEMLRARVSRVAAISAVPVAADSEKTWFERRVLHPILWKFFGGAYRDLRVMEAELAVARGIQAAIVRPPLLTDDEGAGVPPRMAWDERLPGVRKISRHTLARVMIDVATAEPFRTGILTVTEGRRRS